MIFLTKGTIFLRSYGTSRPIKRESTIYDTTMPHGKLSNKNAMALLGQKRENATFRSRGVHKNTMQLLGQLRDSWPSMATLGHAELTKNAKNFRNQIEKQNSKMKNRLKTKTKTYFRFHFRSFFVFIFVFVFVFVFIFVFVLVFVFAFVFLLSL